ncbi:phage major capsid protein [Megasphaera vaginalis (ex Srinivasan et al. 2021)]|uniref:Phage major capsid protein, HK97 family n=1 Tax=Megasphaera vaginalis (ex Srinivasan et al. 2021) TaxID=1111454 RepID=U7UV89_9FIRM|nr:phage major capsid protein [Megasphaera vaginalis (ex Srinivasan et al. 2021)]ERT62388.1 phage major capsid protein, HK97 family [Megasphaera vaginalis (ex Srinivasan et al. 2021)]
MTEKERELRQQMTLKTQEVQNFLKEDKLDDAERVTAELRNMKRELEVLKTVEDVAGLPPVSPKVDSKEDEVVDKTHVLAQVLRRGKLNDAEMSYAQQVVDAAGSLIEGTPASGGFIVPVDAQTKINELKRTLNPLSGIVRIENVNTLSGTRVLEATADMTPFVNVAEMAQIDETDAPTFTQIKYTVAKYAGILPISKELLADTDQNLLTYVYNWLAKKSVVTENTKIVSVLNGLSKSPVAKLDDVKKILNVTLDPALSLLSTVVTNQDGFNYLDTQKDTQGDYLLQPNPLDPTQKMLFGRPVKVVSNKTLPTDTGKAPLIIGSMTDAVVLFDRQAITLQGTDIGGNSFLRDSYDIKAVTRFDVQPFDPQAAVFGQIALA